MRDLALGLRPWDIRTVSARIVDVDGVGPVSGHDGERPSVLCGGMLGLVAAGDREGAARLEDEIDGELSREARAFGLLARANGGERQLLELATILTHNAGDVMQALSAKGGRGFGEREKTRFADLARERFERYEGAFGRAAALYRALPAPEGHRHYPLREVKLLRRDAALLLPLGPFLDDWGATLARHAAWRPEGRAQVVGGIVDGFRKVAGGESYGRALAGFDAAYPGGLEARDIGAHYTSSVRRELKGTELRRKLAVRRESFESSYGKRARAVLASWRGA